MIEEIKMSKPLSPGAIDYLKQLDKAREDVKISPEALEYLRNLLGEGAFEKKMSKRQEQKQVAYEEMKLEKAKDFKEAVKKMKECFDVKDQRGWKKPPVDGL